MNKLVIYLAATALLVGSLIGGLVVNSVKTCPEPVVVSTYEADSLREQAIRWKISADSAMDVAQRYEDYILEQQSARQPVKIRVQNATRYYSTADLDQLDSLLGADPEQ